MKGMREVETSLSKMDSVVVWNVRGVNSLQKQQSVRNFLNTQAVGVVCLLETKVKPSNMGSLYKNVFQGWCFTSNSNCHKGGRIVVAWNPMSFSVDFGVMTSQIVHCVITSVQNSNICFRCSFVYGHNEALKRGDLWMDLRKIASMNTNPWLVVGDFNCVLNTDERVGSLVSSRETADFRSCVCDCALTDLKGVGQFYTWSNKQQGADRVFCKLDRALVGGEWSGN